MCNLHGSPRRHKLRRAASGADGNLRTRVDNRVARGHDVIVITGLIVLAGDVGANIEDKVAVDIIKDRVRVVGRAHRRSWRIPMPLLDS